MILAGDLDWQRAFTVPAALWRRVDEPSQSFSGRLSWDPEEGAWLEIPDALNAVLSEDSDYTVVGEAGGLPITLLGCWSMGGTVPIAGVASARIRAFGGVVVGARLKSVSEPVLASADVELSGLPSLCARTSLKTEPSKPAKGKRAGLNGTSYRWDYPEPFAFTRAGLRTELVRTPQEKHRGDVTSLRDRVVLRISGANRLVSLEELIQHAFTLNELVTFASRQISTITSIDVRGPAAVVGRAPLQVEYPARYIDRFHAWVPTVRASTPARFVVLDRNEASFQLVVRRWLATYDTLAPIIGLRFAAGLQPIMTTETDFLNVATALEGLHRRLFPSERKPHELERRNRIASSLSDEDGAWLKEKMAHVHEPSFADRINGTLNYIGVRASAAILDDQTAFVRAVVKNRNALAHWDPDPKKQFDLMRAPALTGALRMLLDLALLRHLGTSKTGALGLVCGDHHFQLTVHRLRSAGL